jgi:broad specificity phosphatase PhoE
MKIYLARHGQNEDNRDGILNGHRDLPLTELGRKQAHEAAASIKSLGLTFDVVYSSPLIRAFETASIISSEANQPTPVAHPLLIERNLGLMSGRPIASIKEHCGEDVLVTDVVTYFLAYEGAETFPDLVARAKVLLAELKQKYTDESILLVGHGDMGKMIYAAYYDLPWSDVLKQFHFGNSELLLLSPDSDPLDTHVFSIAQHNH